MDEVVSLQAFVAATAFRPILWGQDDCALWCASAVQDGTGFDPAADLRGSYDSWMACRRLVMGAGGLLNLIAPRMQHESLQPLRRNGVAVVSSRGRQLCAVILDGHAIMRRNPGVCISDDFKLIRGWSWSRR